ncbi:hypothetical protein [Exiguobacterium artemiae]|uniref:hypothetical protein n=1 Tax=Exiguobacterium artemiae TaxID=340145 RepID=UPI002964858F|nr:hypothetical protein [Exiguobacterium sibiricum]MDW2886704.1 hypothetical protein [Exiguobacterium sibiricum]
MKFIDRIKKGYGVKKEVKDLTNAQTIYRLLFGLFKLLIVMTGMNSTVNYVEGIIGRLIMQVALETGNMFYVYVVMVPSLIVLTGIGLYFVLRDDVGEIIHHTYKQRFNK